MKKLLPFLVLLVGLFVACTKNTEADPATDSFDDTSYEEGVEAEEPAAE